MTRRIEINLDRVFIRTASGEGRVGRIGLCSVVKEREEFEIPVPEFEDFKKLCASICCKAKVTIIIEIEPGKNV